MARKVVNRKELRAESEAAEKKKKAAPKKKTAPKKKAATRKKKSRAAAEVRLKAFWGVFNQSLRRVALFEYHERKKADKKAAELSTSSKSPHFVQPVKEAVDEVE